MKLEEMMAAENDAAWSGYQGVRAKTDAKLLARLAWASRVINNEDGLAPDYARARLLMALGTADFPYLAGQVLDRSLMAEFQETAPNFERVFQHTTRRDFRKGQAIAMDGADGKLQEVPPSGEYTDAQLTETAYEYAIKKWGKRIPLAWELLRNDDLGAFRSIPARFGRGSRRTREWYLASLFWDANGPIDAYFAANIGGQASVSALPLNAANLGTAISTMAQYKNKNGEPIVARPKYLAVGPSLEQTAIELVSERALAVIATGVKNTTEVTRVSSSNEYVRRLGLEVITVDHIAEIVTSGTKAATTWALFTDPADIACGEVADLEGEVGPQIFMKVSDQQRVGGSVDPMGGSFQNDSVDYKVRMCFNAMKMRTQAGWASDGQ